MEVKQLRCSDIGISFFVIVLERERSRARRSTFGRRAATERQRSARGTKRSGAPFRLRTVRSTAQSRLKRFRQGGALAVAATGLFLLMFGGLESTGQEGAKKNAEGTNEVTAGASTNAPLEVVTDPSASLEQATGTIRDMFSGAIGLVPKVFIAILFLGLAGLVGALASKLLRYSLGRWQRTDAVIALTRIGIFMLAIGAGLSVIAGDVRALVGSIGLVGLALSWALQTPIESFTGWLLNSFRGYYRVGDRIEVGDVFGDVYKIDVLTTTVWEAGGPGKAVVGAQATGAMITFPNWEVLRSIVVNYSRDFPCVWDEVTFAVTNESDLDYTIKVIGGRAKSLLGSMMQAPAEQYRQLLERAKLKFDVEEEPSVFVAPADSWTNFTVRYLVPARARRRWATKLYVAVSNEISRPEHAGKITPAYPRRDVVVRSASPEV